MNTYKIEFVDQQNLHFDYKNPRLAEFNLTESTSEIEILKILWEAMSVEEIVLSIVSSGFFQHEPLIIVEEKIKKKNLLVVIEGNRRLAAVKTILNSHILETYGIKVLRAAASAKVKKEIQTLPVIKVKSREEAWKYIGFKHINGPAKWGSYAKAQYIAQIHREFKIPLNDIAVQIGDTHNTVQKLFQGLMIIDQAEREKVFNKADITGSRLFFSHLYTSLGYEGIREFIGVTDKSEESLNPVPKSKMKDLGFLLLWLFGSKKNSLEPVIRSQNPDLRRLDSVLKNKEATIALKNKTALYVAYEMSKPGEDVFEESLVAAKQDLQKAYSFVSFGYKGDIEPLITAETIYNLAQDLYEAMQKKSLTSSNEKVSKRKAGN